MNPNNPQDKPRYDVVIYHYATLKIESMAGTDLPVSGSFHTVGKRYETVAGRLNDDYGVAVVPPGVYKKGDTLNVDHVVDIPLD